MKGILIISFFSVNTIISVALAILLAKDAQKRGMNVGVWGGLTCLAGICGSLFGWLGMTLIYFLIRQPVEIESEERDEGREAHARSEREPSYQPQAPKSGDIGHQPIDNVVFQRSESPTAETSKSTLPVDAVSPDASIQPTMQQDSEVEEDAVVGTLPRSHTPDGSVPESFEPLGNVSQEDALGAYESSLGEEPDDTEINLDDNATAMLEVSDVPAVFARLFVTIGPDKGKEFVLPTDEEERVLIGRKPPSDIILTDGTVSGEHALIKVDGGEYRLSDQASKHGTFVYKGGKIEEDEKVRVEQPLSLQDNDVIEMGRTFLIFVKVGG